MIRKAIVTGATGAVGTALVNKLISEGVETLVLVRKNGRIGKIPNNPLVSVQYCALDEMESFCPQGDKDYDVFFHLAWAGTYGDSRNDASLQEKNIKYELDAVKLAYTMGCKVFVSAGSQAENGRLPFGEKLSPTSPENPENGYGIAKLAAGKLGRILCQQYGIRYNRCRILSAYGTGDGSHTMVMSTILKFLRGEKAEFTKGEQLWDFIYNGDVADAFYAVALKGREGAVYTLGSGQVRPLREYIEQIRDTAAPDAQCHFGSIDYFPNQVMYLCADISDLENDTGFRPSVSFEEGIRATVDWCRKNYL